MKDKVKAKVEEGSTQAPDTIYIEISAEGPYLVYGMEEIGQEVIEPDASGCPWTYRKADTYKVESQPCALCRCGESHNKPFCDGSHVVADWDRRETAGFKPLLSKVEEIEGPRLVLTDNEEYCAYQRFCDARGRIWNLVQVAETPEEIELVKREAAHCVSGRLIVWDRASGKPHEQEFKPSVCIVEDLPLKISGPIVVKGGIRIESASGKSYQVRNRVTLCRCGQSSNKPFCDGTHASMEFKDGLPLGKGKDVW